MINENEISDRLRCFIKLHGLNQRQFQEKYNINHAITKYLKGELKITSILDILFNAGCNLNWLIIGDGEPFANNSKGLELRNENNISPKITKKILGIEFNVTLKNSLERIEYFVNTYYGNFKQFSKMINTSTENILDPFKYGADVPITLYLDLERAGVNIDWLLTGKGAIFSNSVIGKQLANINNSEVKKENQINEYGILKKIDLENIRNIFLETFKELQK